MTRYHHPDQPMPIAELMATRARIIADIRAIDPAYDYSDIRVACYGYADEHWQVRYDDTSPMPDWVWTPDEGAQRHPG